MRVSKNSFFEGFKNSFKKKKELTLLQQLLCCFFVFFRCCLLLPQPLPLPWLQVRSSGDAEAALARSPGVWLGARTCPCSQHPPHAQHSLSHAPSAKPSRPCYLLPTTCCHLAYGRGYGCQVSEITGGCPIVTQGLMAEGSARPPPPLLFDRADSARFENLTFCGSKKDLRADTREVMRFRLRNVPLGTRSQKRLEMIVSILGNE